MSSKRGGFNRKYSFRKKNQENPRKNVITDISVIDYEPSNGYYGFKIYFPDIGIDGSMCPRNNK